MTGGIAIIGGSAEVDVGDIVKMVDAVAKQAYMFCAQWSRIYCPPVFYSDANFVPAGMAMIAVVDNSDQANALGYHTLALGRPMGLIAWHPVKEADGEVLTGPLSLSSVLSHEVLETIINPFVSGREGTWAREVCDPVQDGSYPIDGVMVSNYVLPAFFNPQDVEGPWDAMGILSAAYSLSPEGYAITDDGQIGLRAAHRPVNPWSRANRRR
jgi:hypothetical protein